MKKTRHYGLLLLLITAMIVVAFYVSQPRHPQTHIGINTWSGYDPLLLAESLQLFSADKVPVNIHQYTSTADTMQALRDGHLQGGAFTLDEVFSLLNEGLHLKVVLVMDYSLGGDVIIAQPEFQTIEDLRGKRVAYEGTVISEFLFYRALQIHSLKLDDTQPHRLAATEWINAFRRHEIDALVCYNPYATQLIEESNANLLFSSTEIPYEIIDVLVFDEAFLARNRNTVKQIMKAWFHALDYLRQSPADAALRITQKRNIAAEGYLANLQGIVAPDLAENQHLFQLESPQNIYKYSQRIVEFMFSKNLLDIRISNANLFAADMLNSLSYE